MEDVTVIHRILMGENFMNYQMGSHSCGTGLLERDSMRGGDSDENRSDEALWTEADSQCLCNCALCGLFCADLWKDDWGWGSSRGSSSSEPRKTRNTVLVHGNLNIDKEHRVGGIFVATEMTQFSRFEVGDDGTVFFQWKGFGDKNYQFKGTLKADELAGEIELVDKRSGNSKYLCDMAASQLPSQNVQASSDHQMLSVLYSNAHYFNELRRPHRSRPTLLFNKQGHYGDDCFLRGLLG